MASAYKEMWNQAFAAAEDALEEIGLPPDVVEREAAHVARRATTDWPAHMADDAKTRFREGR